MLLAAERGRRKVPLTVLKNTRLLADPPQPQLSIMVQVTVTSEENVQSQDQNIAFDFYTSIANCPSCLSASSMARWPNMCLMVALRQELQENKVFLDVTLKS